MKVSPNEITRGGTHYKPRPDFLFTEPERPRQRTRTTTGAGSVFPSNRQRTEPLKILQLNVQGGMTLRHAQMSKQLLQERGIHVILAQEVLLESGKSYSLPGYQMYHCSCIERKKKCRGIATFIRRGLKASVENIKTPTGTDAQKIALWWDGERFDLINWYQPPSDKQVSLDVGEYVHRYKRTIIAGDANAHHMAFAYENIDACGQWIIDVTTSTNLTCLVTDKSEPTFLHSKGGLYRPDTVLVSSDILELVTREVLEDVGSDHLPALITVGIFSRRREKEASTWNFNKADWKAYAHALDTRLESVDWNALTVEKANEALVNEIIRAAMKSIPRGVRKKFTPRWTEELKRAVSKRQAARKDFIRNPTATNRKRYNAYSRRAKRTGETIRATE